MKTVEASERIVFFSYSQSMFFRVTFCFHEKNWPIQFVDRKKSLFCLVLARCFFREAGGFTKQILDVPADPVISLRIAEVYFQIVRSHPGKYLCL